MPKPKTEQGTQVTPLPQNDRRQRRKFTAEYKARILAEAAASTDRGDLAALLHREGLYSSHLTAWREQYKREGEAGLQAKRPGPAPTRDAKDKLIEKQQKKIAAMEKELRIQRALLELQGKAHEILGIALPRVEPDSDDDWSSASESAPRRSR